jgi:hypothetical protein
MGIDCRGSESYIVLNPSFIIDDDGNKKYYVAIDDWSIKPTEITECILEKLKIIRKEKLSRGTYISNETTSEKVVKAKAMLSKLPVDFAEDRDSWVQVGMALRDLGDDLGYKVWNEWTETTYFSKKPNSKRIGDLERVWKNLFAERNDKITLGSLYFWSHNKEDSSL